MLKLCNQELLVVDLDADTPPEPSISLPFDIASALERAIIFSTNADSSASRRRTRTTAFRHLTNAKAVGKNQTLCRMQSDTPVPPGDMLSGAGICGEGVSWGSFQTVNISVRAVVFGMPDTFYFCFWQNKIAIKYLAAPAVSVKPFRLPAPPPSAIATVTFNEVQRIRFAFICAVCSIIRKIPMPLPITKQYVCKKFYRN